MDISEISSRAQQLREQINYHNNRYYNMDSPEISDYEYDMMLRELEQIEAEHPELASADSPTNRVGGEAAEKFSPVVHTVPMESLHDSFSHEEIREFDRRIRETIEAPVYTVEPKIDGLSVSAEYRDGIFVRGSTRGDGAVGEDITDNLKTIRSLPMRLTRPVPYLEVRGEVYMSIESFETLTKRQEENGEKTFKNPRNAAAGSLRQKNAAITKQRQLDIFVFNIQQTGHDVAITWDFPDQNAFNLPATATISGNELNVDMPGSNASYKGILEGEALNGTFTQYGFDITLNMTRTGEVQDTRPQETAIEADTNKPYRSEDVTFNNGDIIFSGTLCCLPTH